MKRILIVTILLVAQFSLAKQLSDSDEGGPALLDGTRYSNATEIIAANCEGDEEGSVDESCIQARNNNNCSNLSEPWDQYGDGCDKYKNDISWCSGLYDTAEFRDRDCCACRDFYRENDEYEELDNEEDDEYDEINELEDEVSQKLELIELQQRR